MYLVTFKYWCKKLIMRTCCYFTYCKTRRYNWWFKEYVNSSSVNILIFFVSYFSSLVNLLYLCTISNIVKRFCFCNQSFVFTGYKMCDNLMIVFALPVLCFMHLVCALGKWVFLIDYFHYAYCAAGKKFKIFMFFRGNIKYVYEYLNGLQ